MADKSIFEQIESRFSSRPLVRNKKVFLRSEYQKETGLSESYAAARLKRLAIQGVVRRVRTVRDGHIVQAWEFLA
jgi:hypothetical protein